MSTINNWGKHVLCSRANPASYVPRRSNRAGVKTQGGVVFRPGEVIASHIKFYLDLTIRTIFHTGFIAPFLDVETGTFIRYGSFTI